MYHQKPNPNKLINRILLNRFRPRKYKVPCPQRKSEESKDGFLEVSNQSVLFLYNFYSD